MTEIVTKGPGGRIALDPVGLRTSARKLRDVRAELDLDASRLAAKPVPVMPDGLAASVAAELAAIAENVRAESVGAGVTADDLDRRVLIAEVTDDLKTGGTLSAATLALLIRELNSGGLLSHVTPEEASLLGRAMGKALLSNTIRSVCSSWRRSSSGTARIRASPRSRRV